MEFKEFNEYKCTGELSLGKYTLKYAGDDVKVFKLIDGEKTGYMLTGENLFRKHGEFWLGEDGSLEVIGLLCEQYKSYGNVIEMIFDDED